MCYGHSVQRSMQEMDGRRDSPTTYFADGHLLVGIEWGSSALHWTDVNRISVKMVLALALSRGLF
jgi:hypothetical protein